MLRQMASGGVIAYAIMALSVMLLALSILFLLQLRHATQCPEELLEEVEAHVAQRRWGEATEMLSGDPSALAPVLEALLGRRGTSEARLEETLSEAAAEQSMILSQRIGYVGLIAAIAPMLGLLGTVSGMIRAFATMSASSGATDASQLAGAISEALITTYLGLIVAIPALIVHTVLKHRVLGISLRIGEMGEQLITVLRGSPGGRTATGSAGSPPTSAARRP